MLENSYIVPSIPDVKIPVEIESFSEESVQWTFAVYLAGLAALGVDKEESDFLLVEQDSLAKLYEWLESNVFPYIQDKQKHELCFGIGIFSSIEGIIDYIPPEYLVLEE